MKKIFLISLVLAISVMSFTIYSPQPNVINNLVVQFVTTNGYGNNIYVDNLLIVGNQLNNDVAVSGVNILRDTNYATGVTSFKISPTATIVNVGKNTATSFPVIMTVTPSGYSSSKTISSLTSGNLTSVTFDSLTITVGTPLNIKIITNLSNDENRANDTLAQYTIYFGGVTRKPIMHHFTSSTCAPCAQNDPTLDAFIAARFDSVCYVNYHMNWPSPGNDPMYAANSAQNNERRSYYAVNGVPSGNWDGQLWLDYPYVTASMSNQYYTRIAKGSPLTISVVDTKLAGDSIKANITVQVLAPMAAGNYKLKVEQIGHVVRLPSAWTNGQIQFPDVFKRAYPTTSGVAINTAPGTYNFEYRYKMEPLASPSGTIDSTIYTQVYIQNDVTKEVINSGKARNYMVVYDEMIKQVSNNSNLKQSINPFPIENYKPVNISVSPVNSPDAGFNYEIFEGGFPPNGWTITNSDGSLTWEPYIGANGSLFGGTKSTRVNCYNYSSTGQMDYLKSKVFNNIDLSDTLKFNWAHAVYTGYTERLRVQVSTDGGINFPYTIFDRSGSALATATATSNDFVPTSSQWGTFSIAIGSFIVGINQIGTEVPTHYALNQNYPNPFNPTTTISYMIPKSSNVSLKVYNINGQLIETLFDGSQNAGIYMTQFDASKLASGIYFYKLESGDFKEVKKMTVLK